MHPTIQQIVDTKVLPLFYADNYEVCRTNILACCEAGVNVFEFTNRGKSALGHFKQLKKEFSLSHPDLKLGVGTIYTAEEAKAFVEAGADFIIQPVCVKTVANFCKKTKTPWIPGAMTLNEIYQAMQLGAELVKIFPGNTVGKAYIKAIRGPLPDVHLMVTGGVEASADDILSWLEAGANACGLGSQLFARKPADITALLSGIHHAIRQ
jgi:2-dehydro-3-deoxyphosphogluconate aldolase / (4S)-4-hydroxy-2-oxoglutarate aldolase